MPETGLHFDEHAFHKSAYAVTAATKISWNDYESMHTYQHKASGERRLATPLWALNDSLLKELLVTFMEQRLQIYGAQGTLLERREAARSIAIADRPRWAAKLDELNHRYVQELKEGAPQERLRGLEVEIENLDTYIRTTENGGIDLVAAVVYLYYRCKWDSVRVGTELNIKPPHVRQIIYKLKITWRRRFNEDGTLKPCPPPRSARSSEVKKPRGRPFTWSLPEAFLMRIFGLSFQQIADQMGVCHQSVYSAFRRYEIRFEALRPTPTRVPKPKPEPKPKPVKFPKAPNTPKVTNPYGRPRTIDTKRAAELHAAGMTWAKIATELGVSSGETVLMAVQRDGLWEPTRKKKKAEACAPAPVAQPEVCVTA